MLSSNRFLFIVDASASMKPFDEGVRQTVFDLIYSGLRGRMTNGDTFGLWVVRNQNDTSYPMDVWRSRHVVEMSAKAAARVKERGFKSNARLDLAMADALRVVRNVGDLTIVLVSNGETPIAGTPFDDAINARFRELAPKMKRGKSTLNTVLVAQNGSLVAWAINGPEFLIEVPYVVPKPRPAQAEIALAKTNAASAPISNAPAAATVASPASTIPVAGAKPRVSTNPIIITKETVAQEKREWAALASTATNESAAGETNFVAAVSLPTNGTAPSTNLITNAMTAGPLPFSAHPSTNAPVSKALVATAVASASNSIAANSNNTNVIGTKTIRPKTEERAAAPVPPAAPAAIAARVEPSQPVAQPLIWASLGGAAAVVCVLIGVLVARGQRREASLISRAVARQGYSVDG